MCGIAGLLRPEGVRAGDRDLVQSMCDALAHRGPDDSGLVMSPSVVLGHRRLSILDPEGGQQPLTTGDGRHRIVYNGELYNYRELAKNLEAAGVKLQTRCDSEVVLEALAHWGLAALDRFEGMFAFAWVDVEGGRLRLVRDRLGIKPLYWTRCGGSLRFASEVPAFFVDPELVPVPDPVGVSAFLSFRHALAGRSLYRDVAQVEAGACVEFALDDPSLTPRLRQWWKLPVPHEEPAAPELSDAMAMVETFFLDAVGQRLIADVPLGAYLSGGLDSSLVVAAMTALTGAPVRTFTIGFADPGYSEFEWARRVAEHCGTDHREIRLDSDGYLSRLDAAIRASGGPLAVPNEVPLLELSFAMKKVFSVVLSGEGADELFGGYGRIFRSAEDSLLLQALATHPELAQEPQPAAFLAAAKRCYGEPLPTSHVDFFLEKYRYMPLGYKHELLAPEVLAEIDGEETIDAPIRSSFARVAHLHPVLQFLHVFQVHHLQGLLRRLDRMTMAAGLEARVPFCDHRLVTAVQRLPWEWKLRWKSLAHERGAAGHVADEISERYDTTKWILKAALGHLVPPEIVERRKVGFPVPLDRWFGGDGAGTRWMLDILEDRRTRQNGFWNGPGLGRMTRGIADGTASAAERRHAFYVCGTELWMRQLSELHHPAATSPGTAHSGVPLAGGPTIGN